MSRLARKNPKCLKNREIELRVLGERNLERAEAGFMLSEAVFYARIGGRRVI